MLELTQDHELTPELLRAELATARRIADNMPSLEDRRMVEDYISDLEQLSWGTQFVASE
jgi:hypothetical protein